VSDHLHVSTNLVDALVAASSNERALAGRASNIGGGVINAASVLEVVEVIEVLRGVREGGRRQFAPGRG